MSDDLPAPAPVTELHRIADGLDRLGDDLRHLWSLAMAGGSFVEVERLVSASHALHRASIALRTDGRLGVRDLTTGS